ncbi:MAG: phosphoribosylanthranilate isomerase [Lachnospiraceae bacterium]|nr:phosphoribosylanthranilate isomerase [Lachnospiraceae bacterium]
MKRTKIKICGLFRSADIEYANEVQPDYAGFILTPGFRRSISREQALQLRRKLNREIPAVGVFVDAPCEEVVDYLKKGIIQMAQLHGRETEKEILYIKAAAGKPVLKAVKVQDRKDVEAWLGSAADYLVFDGGTGSGRTFDWRLLEGISEDYFLAGGLNPGNLKEALALRPYAVDLSSGVETEGVKDRAKMQAVVELVRNHFRLNE